jgi:MFS family permease
MLYSLISLGLEFIVWFAPSLIGDAVAVSFVGFFLGPLYPIAMSYSSYLIPQHVLSAAIGVVCGLGQTGSAVLPFLTGALASKYGIHSMQPLYVFSHAVCAPDSLMLLLLQSSGDDECHDFAVDFNDNPVAGELSVFLLCVPHLLCWVTNGI